MKIIFNIKEVAGYSITAYAFANATRLVNNIRETKTVNFFVKHRTKTSLDITISNEKGHEEFGIAHIPSGMEKYKFHEQSYQNIFDSRTVNRKFFKITKTQGMPELQDYLTAVLRDMNIGLQDDETLTATIILYKVPELTK